jgi:nitroreductase
MNRKTWHFTIVTDKKRIADLAKAIGSVIDRKDYNFYQPTALIIPSNDPENHLGADDNACAMQNIMLAAQSFGVGSVWINQLKGICNDPAIRTQLDALKIPGNYVVYGLAALGYPKNDFPPAHESTGNFDII